MVNLISTKRSYTCTFMKRVPLSGSTRLGMPNLQMILPLMKLGTATPIARFEDIARPT